MFCLLFLLLACLQLSSSYAASEYLFDMSKWNEVSTDLSDPKPYPPKNDLWKHTDTPFLIMLASYRDDLCGRTIKNIFDKAKYPDRITVGVVQQHLHGKSPDPDCMDLYCNYFPGNGCPRKDQIRIVRVSSMEAKGPIWGRYFQNMLVQDEDEFCMQIDAHMDFEKGFDEGMMESWALTENEYAVLATYVHDLAALGINIGGRHEVAHICKTEWGAKGVVRNQRAKNAHSLKRPLLAPAWAAGMSFGRCHYMRRVPYDPHLPQIFDGEEFSMFARMWTRGYDVYSPHRSYVLHDYHRQNRKSWGPDRQEMDVSAGRLKTLMGLPDADKSTEAVLDLGRYGLGSKRSLDQLIEFVGIDVRSKTIFANKCATLKWVPFEEDSDLETEKGSPFGQAPLTLPSSLPDSLLHAEGQDRGHLRGQSS